MKRLGSRRQKLGKLVHVKNLRNCQKNCLKVSQEFCFVLARFLPAGYLSNAFQYTLDKII